MKQKYSLSIADVILNVTVDESPEVIEYVTGVVDRKMREILLKSKYCPKTQAALLCALDLCVDKVKALAPDANVMITRAGCTISSHCGRNTLGVLFIRKNPIE